MFLSEVEQFYISTSICEHDVFTYMYVVEKLYLHSNKMHVVTWKMQNF